jgi:hypothetical protein
MSEPGDAIDWDVYLDAVGALIGMPVASEHRAATIAQLKLNAAIAGPLLAFEMPEGTNPAPVFKP